jgi:hypothetical protein
MRLLQIHDEGSVRLATFTGNKIPRYAILSHRWEADDQEVTFQDLKIDSKHEKAGYRKIQFYREQAQRDGLQYFWIDSCCTIQSHH